MIDRDDDFYEDDEPIEKIRAAYANGRPVVVAPAPGYFSVTKRGASSGTVVGNLAFAADSPQYRVVLAQEMPTVRVEPVPVRT